MVTDAWRFPVLTLLYDAQLVNQLAELHVGDSQCCEILI